MTLEQPGEFFCVVDELEVLGAREQREEEQVVKLFSRYVDDLEVQCIRREHNSQRQWWRNVPRKKGRRK
jgi:hypothetical protein